MLKVLLAVDWSPSARQTLDFARDVLAEKEAAVTILHVITQHIMYGRGGGVPLEVYDMPQERATSQALLRECAEYLRAGGVGPVIEGQLALGDPADLILTAATQHNVDLIITGSHGLNAVSRFLFGSTANTVTHRAHCPVLVVRPKEADRDKHARALLAQVWQDPTGRV